MSVDQQDPCCRLAKSAHKWLIRLAVLVLALASARPTLAQATAADRAAAAAAYDEGAELFERAQYADAVAAFLRADDRVKSSDAVMSALIAARKSGDHLLVVKVSARATGRESTDPKLGAVARKSLLEAAQHLARIDLECTPKPCTLTVDDAEVPAGSVYLLPGNHLVVARASGLQPAQEQLRLDAGLAYRVLLRPTKLSSDGTQPQKTLRPPPAPKRPAKPLSPAVFYTGAAATVVLAAVMAWSGVDTLGAKEDLSKEPRQSELEDVKSKIRRTDILLGGTVLVGALTTYAGFALVDWTGADDAKRAGLRPALGGPLLSFSTRF